MRRILAACLLSFLALLGAVSIDLRSNFKLLHSTDTAYAELTSCRTSALLQVVSRLQQLRRLWSKGNNTVAELSLPVLANLCSETAGHSDGYGLPCGVGQPGLCSQMIRTISKNLNASMETHCSSETMTCAFSLAIAQLLDLWGTVQDTLVKVKQHYNWQDVLSVRLLVFFLELHLHLTDVPNSAAQSDFQQRWTYVSSCLGLAKLLSGQLSDCWAENMELTLNSSQQLGVLDLRPWQVPEVELWPWSSVGVEALRRTQQCVFERAGQALRLESRSLSSGLSKRVCLLALACLIYPVVLCSFKQMTAWIQEYAQSLKEKTVDVKKQRQLAEDLLHQMLPKSVAKQLRKNRHVEAESYDKVGLCTQ